MLEMIENDEYGWMQRAAFEGALLIYKAAHRQPGQNAIQYRQA
jgi:hypothetical protein